MQINQKTLELWQQNRKSELKFAVLTKIYMKELN